MKNVKQKVESGLALSNFSDVEKQIINKKYDLSSKSIIETNPKFPIYRIHQFVGEHVAHIACTNETTFVLHANGSLYGFGKNVNGELGIGFTEEKESLFPVKISALDGKNVGRIESGTWNIFALTGKDESAVRDCLILNQ